MGFHHVAVATRDTKATHEFYTQAMGFKLVKVHTNQNPEGGWSKHFFYDTGGNGLIAFWEIHDEAIGDFSPAISTGLGLPQWTNHFAFDAKDRETLTAHRERWRRYGIDVVEIDHEFCTSIYAEDPNGIMVEFCMDNRPFNDEDLAEAEARIHDPNPSIDPPPEVQVFKKLTGD